jgi:hypothetical protein
LFWSYYIGFLKLEPISGLYIINITRKKLFIIISIYNPCFLIITKEAFSLIGMQTNNTLILVLEEFLILKDNKFSKIKFLIKPKEAVAPKNPLIFNRCVLI